jgi:ATP-binding protein involved in chromosome partitioning
MASVTKEQVLAALADVVDPDSGRTVISADLISGVVVRDGNVGFALEVDPDQGAAKEPLRKACEAAVERLPGVLSVTAVLTAERPAGAAPDRQAQAHGHGHSHAPAQGPAQAPARQPAELLPGVRSVIAIASGKGGVGKSTTAVNLATAMAAQNIRVGLLDCDIYGPSIPRMLNLSGQPQMVGERTLRPMANYGIKCMSIGFLVAEDTAMIWRGPMVMQALEQMMRDVDWGELDVLLCDLPPGTGDAQLTMAQRVPLTGAVIVSTPQDIALLDVTRGINMFQQVNVPIFGVVENMSYYVCPECGHRAELFHHGGARETARRLGVDFLGEIPLDIAIRTTSDSGRPIVVAQPESPHAAAYRRIAAGLIDKATSAVSGAGRAQPRIVMM